ncbi:MAG: glycohydrolase toxin TNT-related protein [Eubacterium sp.]|nr:glycohydrolase toxin TNT-related protein [Eubacterium sp.]
MEIIRCGRFAIIRRVISFVLVIGMVIGLVPETAFAASSVQNNVTQSSSDVKSVDDDCVFEFKEKTDVNPETGNQEGYTLPDEYKALGYALFTSDNKDISLYTYKTKINGDVHTNKNFFFQGTNLEVSGTVEASKKIDITTASGKEFQKVGSKKEKADKIEIPDISNDIKENVLENGTVYKNDKFFDSDKVVVDKPILSEGHMTFSSTSFLGQGIIYAKKNITYNVGSIATPRDSRVFLMSEAGNITINGSSINLNATIYAPNGIVNINANEFHLNGRIIAKAVNINGSIIEINAGPQDLDLISFVFKPEVFLKSDGTFKQNRSVTFTAEGKDGKDFKPESIFTWTVTRDGEDASDIFVTTKDSTDIKKVGLFKEPGHYTVTVSVSVKGNVGTASEEIDIIPDASPIAGFILDSDKYFRTSDGKAHIKIADASVSPDGDEIDIRRWTVYYDKNNNGIFEESESVLLSDKNEKEVSVDTDKVGKYKVVLDVQETFGNTIPELLTDADYLKDSTEDEMQEQYGVFEVDNEAPEANLEIEKAKAADIVFTVGDVSDEKLQIYNEKAAELENILKAKGVDTRIETVSSKKYTAQDKFAWKEYAHHNLDGYQDHIVYEGDDIRMLGYVRNPLSDFLYLDDHDTGKKIFEFDLQRDNTDWHSMEGGGFLFNTDISEEENYIRGYCILVTSGGLRLRRIDCNRFDIFTGNTSGRASEDYTCYCTCSIGNVYDNHHLKIVVDPRSISVWCDDKLVIDNFILPELESGTGFGPITRHLNHACSQRSFFTFKNITMQSMSGSGLSDIIDGYEWRPNAEHYVLNLSDNRVPELSTDESMADLAAAVLKNDAHFVGIGNETNDMQYQSFMGYAECKGLTRSSENLTEEMDAVNNYILSSILSKDYSIKDNITTNDVINYKDIYSDKENDPQYSQQWEYEYVPDAFDVSSLLESNVAENDEEFGIVATATDAQSATPTDADKDDKGNLWKEGEVTLSNGHILKRINNPITVFDITGAYAIRSRVMDDPTYGNSFIAPYRKWSSTNEYQKLLIVQSRPVAEIKAEVSKDSRVKNKALANIIYSAYDPDHPEDSKHGIRQEKFYYKEIGDSSWTEGRLSNSIEIGKTYVVKYQVADVEGTWSYPATAVIKTNNLKDYKSVEDDQAPEVHIDVSKTMISLGDSIMVDAYAVDDHGVSDFALYVDDKKELDHSGITYIVPEKEGIMKMKAVATDMAGNTSEKTVQITVIDDRDVTLPVAEIISPAPGSELGFDIEFIGTAKDENKLDSYTLSYKKTSDEEYKTFAEGKEPIENGLLGKLDITGFEDGLYDIRFHVEDAAGNARIIDMQIYVEAGKTEKYTISCEIKDIVLNKETEEIEIKGSAEAEGHFSKYELVYQPEGSDEVTEISEGTKEVKDELLGKIPLTTLKSGKYNLYLYVEDTTGTRVRCDASFDYKEGETVDPDTDNSKTEEKVETPDTSSTEQNENKKFSLNLSHSRTSVGTQVTAQVTLADGMKKENLKLYKGDEILAENSLAAKFTSEKTGRVKIRAVYTLDETEKENNKGDDIVLTAECTFFNGSDKTAPVAEITTDTFTEPIKQITTITGTATDETELDFWRLEYRLKPYADYTLIAEGTESIKDGEFGKIDPTLMMNGEYELRLKVQDQGGNIKTVTRDFVVEGDLKIGNFHIGFTDVTTSMGGTTVNVNRIYDTRNKKQGDFGYGWTMDLTGTRLTESNSIASGYTMERTGSAFSTTYRIKETKNHDVIVSYGDGTSDRFSLVIGNGISALRPISEIYFGYKCETSQKVKLEILADTTAFYEGGQVAFYDESVYDTLNYKLTTADGNELYLNKSLGVYKIVDAAGHVIKVDKNGYHSEDGKNIEFKRDSEGRISSITEPNGNTTIYKYDLNGDLVSVTDSADRTVSFTYDNDHNLMSITDPMGIAVSRNEYDAEGRLIATIDAEGNRIEYDHDIDGRQKVVSDRLGNKTVYVYDDNGNVLQTTDANGHTQKSTYDEFGNVLTFTDARGNVTTTKYDSFGNATSITDADGNSISMEYNSDNKPVKISTVDDKEIIVDYDKAGNILSTKNVDGSVISYDRASDGNIKSISDEIGKVYSAEYDSSGNVIAVSDQSGNVTNYTYDDSGNRLTETTIVKTEEGDVSRTIKYNYNSSGELVSSEDADGNLTTVERNKNGQTTATVDSEGRRTSYDYTSLGKVSKIVYSDGTKEEFTYDAEGRTLSSTDRIGIKKEFAYDKVGNLVKESDSRGNITNFEYDENNNLTKVIYPTGYSITYYFDALNRNTKTTDKDGNTTSFAYDERSLLTSVTDSKGSITNYEYNDRGERVKTIYADGSSESITTDSRGRCLSKTSTTGRKTDYTYDSADRLIKVTQNSGSETVYSYDSQGNLISVKDGNGNETQYKYDVNSRRVATILPDGSNMSYSYDSHGRINEITDYKGVKTIYTYDDEDRPSVIKSGDSVIEYFYDDFGRVKSIKTDDSQISYSYNKYGELEEKLYENGQKIRYGYDEFGRENSVESFGENETYTAVKYEYDSQGRLSKVIDDNKTVSEYTYDSNGNRASTKYSNGVSIVYTYDKCNRLETEKATDRTDKLLAEYSYVYENGLKVKASEKKSDSETISEYERDDEDRLITDKITEKKNGKENVTTYSYEYDKVGNRTSQTVDGVETTYKYNSKNQLVSEETSNDGDKTVYEYDLNGNLISKINNTEKALYTYDVYNRMIGYRCGDIDYSYAYDAEGVRRSKTNNSAKETILFVTDTNCEYSTTLAETDKNGKLNRGYITAGEIISMDFSNQNIYYISDGHGDVRILTDENSAEKATYKYNAYGELLEKTGTIDNSYLYAGEYLDAETGLYYLRARYMDTSIGVFTSMDTYEGSITDPDTLHKYLYANADPVNYTDPSGHFFITSQMICTGIMNVLNNMDKIVVMGLINSTITGGIMTLMGCPEDEVLKGMIKGFVMGAGLGALGFFCTAALGISMTQFMMCNAGAMSITSIFTSLYYALKGDNLNAILYFGMAIISAAQFCHLYGLQGQAIVYGENCLKKYTLNENGVGDVVEVEGGSGTYYNADGSPIWPPNRGFDGEPVTITLEPGTMVDRYGYDGGYFVSPQGTSYTERALPVGTDKKPYTIFEVVKPVEVQSGKIAPWFGEKGGGIQYEFSNKISELLEQGILRKVEH